MATLYVVATPIGNLEDITYRAVRILGEVDVIAAEDTRQTRILLDRYSITPSSLISCRSANESSSARGIIRLLEQGRDVAFVSDAGTPGISDPGNRLAAAVRDAGFPVVPLPGASAVTALMSVAGTAGKGFVFEGFLSPKDGRRKSRLKELLEMGMIFVIYESPYRIIRLVENLLELAPDRKILIGREITKKFEEFLSGLPQEVLAVLSSRSTIKGEFVVLVGLKEKGGIQ
jgi:16S rRNA (cytidine1402-2'-O)-methyltransferase